MGRSTLPQLLMEQFDTLPIQCRHSEHMHEGVIFFVCTDSTEIFFSKLRSAGLNYNLPSFFTDSFCAGVSNKHCLLTFFHIQTLHNDCLHLNDVHLLFCAHVKLFYFILGTVELQYYYNSYALEFVMRRLIG